jgi:hypothetical protein
MQSGTWGLARYDHKIWGKPNARKTVASSNFLVRPVLQDGRQKLTSEW